MNSPGQPAIGHIKSILLVKPGSLGDVIHALPTAVALRENFPDARLSWVVDPRWAPVLEGTGVIDRTILFPRESFRGIGGLLRGLGWYSRISHECPDLTVDLQGLLRSALVVRAARSRFSVGLSDAREGSRFLYSAIAETGSVQHAVDRYLRILPVIGAPIPCTKQFPLPMATSSALDARLPTRLFLALHPFARGDGKSLPPDLIRSLCVQLSPIPVVLLGFGPVIADLPASVVDLTSQTSLIDLIAILRKSAAVVSVDSGPMHIAAALDRPLLSLHTWSDPQKVGPYSTSADILQADQIHRQVLESAGRSPLAKPFTTATTSVIAAWVRQHLAA